MMMTSSRSEQDQGNKNLVMGGAKGRETKRIKGGGAVQKSNLNAFLAIKKEVKVQEERDVESVMVKLKLPRLIVKLKTPDSRVTLAPHPFFVKKSEKKKKDDSADNIDIDTDTDSGNVSMDVGNVSMDVGNVSIDVGNTSMDIDNIDTSMDTSIDTSIDIGNTSPISLIPQKLIHPFFSKSRKLHVGSGYNSDSDGLIPMAATPPPRPASAPNHSFFRKKTAKKQEKEREVTADAQQTPRTFPKLASHSQSTPIQRNISRTNSGYYYPQWPKYLHTHSFSTEECEKLALISERASAHSLASGRKQKKRMVQPIAIPVSNNILNITFEKTRNTNTNSLHKPKRMLLNEYELQELALSSISPTSKSILLPLVNQCGKPSAFDDYSYETLTWSSKYAPNKAFNVITLNYNGFNVLNWVEKRLKFLKTSSLQQREIMKQQKKKRKRKEKERGEMDDFIVDEGEETREDEEGPPKKENEAKSDFLILYGPPGSGKTSSVYAAGQELGCYVFEVNSSQRRSGKNLMALLEGMGQSHLVHKAGLSAATETRNKLQSSIVLLEEVDVLYEEEKSFWSGLEKFSEISKRPIILTCTNPNTLPTSIVESINGNSSTFLEFQPAPETLQVDGLFMIALCGGHMLEKAVLRELVRRNNYDFRLSINDLQFWCQMGVGGRRSGIDWILTRDEAEFEKKTRVISKHTHIEMVKEEDECNFYAGRDAISEASLLPSISNWSSLYDSLSSADIIYSHSRTNFPVNPHHHVLDNDDNLAGINLTEESTIREEPLPFELKIHPEIVKRTVDVPYWQVLLPRAEPTAVIDSTTFKEALSYLGYRMDQWGSTVGQSNQFDSMSTTTIATELIPTVRAIARTDKELVEESERNRHQARNSGSRESRRSYAALGIDTYDKYLDGDIDLDEIINTAPKSWV